MGEDMGVGERRVVIVEGLGKMIGAEPFAMIFGEIVGVEPLAGGVAPAAAAFDPPFAAIVEIDRAKCFHIVFENIMLVAIGENRSEEHTSELQSLMRISYAVFCLKKKQKKPQIQ